MLQEVITAIRDGLPKIALHAHASGLHLLAGGLERITEVGPEPAVEQCGGVVGSARCGVRHST